MIQFKKIPPGKSVLLLLLFLTTNISGFLQEYQQENELSRKTQNRYSMDLQQPSTRNMPIRRTGINREINEKDANSDRLYDRRSFRTGTIERSENINAERSTDRSRAGIRDINNNRQRFTSNSRDSFQFTRDNRRSLDSTDSPMNRLVRNVRDRRVDERTRIVPNRYDSRTNIDLNRRSDRSSEIRDRRNSNIRERNTDIQSRNIYTSNERRGFREQENRRLLSSTERSQIKSKGRFVQESRSTRLSSENRASSILNDRSLELRRSVRAVDDRTRRISEERNIPQRRSAERLERRNSRENLLEARTLENRDSRISSTERSQRNSRENLKQSRVTANSNRNRISLNRGIDQRQMTSETRNQIRSSTMRLQRNSRENPSETRVMENRRVVESEHRNANRRQMPFQRNLSPEQSRQRSIQRTSTSDDRVSERFQFSQHIRSLSEGIRKETRTIGSRRISERENADRSRSVDSRIVRDRSGRSTRERLSRRSVDQRDQTRRDMSRRLLESRIDSAQRRDQRLSDGRLRSIDQSRRIDSRDNRRISLERRETDSDRAVENRRTNVDNRRISREDRRNINTREISRSDSTRYIQDNTYFRDARLARRDDSARISRVYRMENKNFVRESNLIADRYIPMAADLSRDTEKIISQGKSIKDMETPLVNLENNTWANTAKLLLVAFLVGQIFINSSKANKFRFHNIMSMATCVKEKIH